MLWHPVHKKVYPTTAFYNKILYYIIINNNLSSC